MHLSAYETGRRFFNQYASDAKLIVEIGSFNENGTLRDFAPQDSIWIGVDLVQGPGVDLILDKDEFYYPFSDQYANAVVSSSCLEHDRFFWNTFAEMVRICKSGGYIYINMPSNGPVHRYPIDCWRFYPDAAQALADWASHMGYQVKLIETTVMETAPDGNYGWLDFHAIYKRE